MNTILADSLNWIAEKLEVSMANGEDKTAAVITVLQELMELHGNVIFGGDGYSSEWHRIAVEERGLKNIPTSADALPAFKEESVVELFKSTGVLSPAELASRFEVYAEQYILSIEMETNLVVDLASTRIYPATVGYLDSLASAASNLNGLDIEMSHNSIQEIASEANAMMASVRKLKKAISVEDFASIEKHMNYCAKTLCPLMLEVRSHADALECIVADDLWPLPKYQEMLFIR
jgi:glutamine synthetase